MNPEYIRYVKVLASMKSMTKAASSLYISQPTLTKAISSLEQEFGIKLFDRSAKPIALTEAGQIFLKKGEAVLQSLAELEMEMRSFAQGHQFTLRVGTTSERGSVWIPPILSALRRELPHIHAVFVEDNNHGLEEQLLCGNLDVVLYCNRMKDPNFRFDLLGEDPILLLCAKSHPLAHLAEGRANDPYHPLRIPASALKGFDFIMLSEGHGMRSVAEQILYKHDIPCKPTIELNRHETVVRLIAEGFGLGFSSVLTPIRLHMTDDLCYFTLDDPLYCRHLVAAMNINTVMTQELSNFIHLVQTTVSKNSLMCEKETHIHIQSMD